MKNQKSVTSLFRMHISKLHFETLSSLKDYQSLDPTPGLFCQPELEIIAVKENLIKQRHD